MTGQIIKVHNASQISSFFIDIGIITGIICCIIGLVIILYAARNYR
ncbi:hypothetical protein [Silvanigrella aquatica]|nr:hypothetical protein [Silvanigrella aquatica]